MRQHSAPKSPYCACAIGRRAAYCQPAIDAQKATVSAKPIGSASKKSDRIGKADREHQQKKATVSAKPIGSTNKRDEKTIRKKEKNGKRRKKRKKHRN